MNTAYLNTLPEVKNKYKVDLEPGEKVVFTAKLWGFTTETGDMLGFDSPHFTMTNQRIFADNGQGLWITDIAEDVVDMRKVVTGKFLKKQEYILVTMNKEIAYGIGIRKLSGYRFHFHKKEMAAFEEIMKQMV